MWQKLRKGIRQKGGVYGIASFVAALIVVGNLLGWFQLVEWATLDRFFHWRSPEPIDSRIVIVTVKESDLSFVQTWPLSDQKMAEVLQTIKAQQPRLIGLDIFRDLEVPPGHEKLLEVMESTPNLIGIEKVAGETIAPPPTLTTLNQVAAADIVIDHDGKVRRGVILVKSSYGLGAKLALMYLESEGIDLETVDINKKIYRLGQGIFVPLTRKDEGGYINQDTGGYQILLNFRGGLEKFPHISLQEVLQDQIPPNFMRDRIVLIGVTASSLHDFVLTPISDQEIPGIVIHANLTSQMLSAALEDRPLLRPWTQKQNQCWITLWSFISAMVCWSLLEQQRFSKKLRFSETIFTIIITGFCLVGGSYWAFLQGWVILIFSPFLACIVSAILVTNYHYQWQLNRTNEKLKKANQKLEEYAQTLELKVDERTQDLQSTLTHLQRTQMNLVQAEKKAALGQMVAGIAHEINNPISFIYGNVEYAMNYASDLFHLIELYGEKYPQPEKAIQELIDDLDLDYLQQDFLRLLNSMKSGSMRIQEIVQSLRIFSRLDESEIKTVNLHEGIESTLMLLQNRLKSHGELPKIKVIKDYGDFPRVNCYAGQLNQVFMNLFTNAIDALNDQQIENETIIEVRTLPHIKITTGLQGNSQVRISIQDNGPGIPESIQPKLFDPFFTTKPVGKGTGLGLAIAYSIIVDKHGGNLECISTPGQGTEFRITIPLQLTHQSNTISR